MRLRGIIRHFDKETEKGTIRYGEKMLYRPSEYDQIAYFDKRNVLNYSPRRIKSGLQVEFNLKKLGNKLGARKIFIEYEADGIINYYSKNWEEIETSVEARIESKTRTLDSSNSLTDAVNNKLKRQRKDSESIALALFEKRIRLVSLTKDGNYRFLDEAETSHNIIYPSFFEEISLQLVIEEFEDLINSPRAKENDFQNFFERYPDFILNDDYKQAHAHVILTKETEERLIPDFVLEPVDQNSFCDLLELKLPTADIFVLKKNRERYSAAVFEAAAQLREYGKYFDQETNRKNFQQTYPHLRIYKPRMFVIIGRQNNESSMLKREIQAEFPQLFLKTYDELLARMKWKKERLENKNKLFR